MTTLPELDLRFNDGIGHVNSLIVDNHNKLAYYFEPRGTGGIGYRYGTTKLLSHHFKKNGLWFLYTRRRMAGQ